VNSIVKLSFKVILLKKVLAGPVNSAQDPHKMHGIHKRKLCIQMCTKSNNLVIIW